MLAYFSESSPAVVSSRPYFLPQRILSVATETMLGLGGGRSPSNWTEVLRSDFSMLRKEPIDDVSFASTTHFAYGLIVAVIATIILVLVLLKSNATITKYASSSLQSQAFNLQVSRLSNFQTTSRLSCSRSLGQMARGPDSIATAIAANALANGVIAAH